MKFALYLAGIILGIGLGFRRGIAKRNAARTLFAGLLITAGTIGALYPPLVGTFRDVVIEGTRVQPQPIGVLIAPQGVHVVDDSTLLLTDVAGQTVRAEAAATLISTLRHSNGSYIVTVLPTSSHHLVTALSAEPAPALMLSHVPALGERVRIMFFHVPMAWVGFLAYVVTMVFSIRYLRQQREVDDTIAYASAVLGTLFTAAAYLTGAIWAKFNWGHFFNWDTRELSVLLLLAIYAAYFTLRSSITNPQARAKASAVYAIVAAVAAGFLIFIVPRVTVSLHPGSKDDVNIGPILSPQQEALDMLKAIVFSIMLAGFSLLYTWMLNITVRYNQLRAKFAHLSNVAA